MRTIIHIGQHKTGTTSIQHYLRTHRDALARRGLYVPDTLGGFDHPSHFLLNVIALDGHRSSPTKDALLATRPAAFFDALAARLAADVSDHYRKAGDLGSRDVIWTNEGLFLLNSVEEYRRLRGLFDPYSGEVACVCVFREVGAYRRSYIEQLKRDGIATSDDPDSYRYVREDSWLFDYERKKALLRQSFDETLFCPYGERMVTAFMTQIGYPVSDGDDLRLNVSQHT